MSAVSTATSRPRLEPARTLTPGPGIPDGISRPRRPRNPFPVGARFPRRSAAEVHAYRPQSATGTAAAAVFPVGARFPRRTQSDILAYPADIDLGLRAPVRRSHPVGARFPRRPE
jgi:hypothetical protein